MRQEAIGQEPSSMSQKLALAAMSTFVTGASMRTNGRANNASLNFVEGGNLIARTDPLMDVCNWWIADRLLSGDRCQQRTFTRGIPG